MAQSCREHPLLRSPLGANSIKRAPMIKAEGCCYDVGVVCVATW